MSSSFYPSDDIHISQSCIKEPVAIIGIGCRFPGGANSPQDFWKILSLGVNAITPVPPDRWQNRSFYDPDPAKPGKTYVRYGGFIKDIDLFDAGFFGISPREASRMDPQQRLLLEVAYEALEDAGLAPEVLAGSNTGVFVGISTCDYGGIQVSATERRSINAYTNLGLGMCIAANRISYLFDFHGPSIAVDTACSSSLVAVHLACQGIWNGECEMALAGGVNAILRPEGTIGFSKASMLSPSGRCKSFDAGADGYVRAEGAGIIFLKPLSKAYADGDPIYAVIRGTAINQDGRTGGIAFPSRLAQELILKGVYQQAGISPERVHYIEAHGTGTSAGDPIELNAIGNALTKNRPLGDECIVGSVKTNIGHLEAASGIAGLIKVALSLKHGEIPANLHFDTPNPEIDFESLRIRVPQLPEQWPTNGRDTRFAGVNSFGFGGTNAHVILGTAPQAHDVGPIVNASLNGRQFVFPISARSGEALQAFVHSYLGFLTDKTQSDVSLSDICYTASLRRGHHDHRLAVAARSKEELVEYLEAFLAGETRLGMSSGRRIPGQSHKLAFVFSGMGPQWWAMGRELLEEEPVFREVIEKCDELLSRYADWSLLNELKADEGSSRINETQIAQPAVFSIQIALAALWRSWGIEPEGVLGHSVGEVAAAYVSGALNLEDAVLVIFNRSRLQQRTAGQGAMLAVGLNFEEAENLIKGYEGLVSIGAVNSPSDVTLSGDTIALTEISESLKKKEVFSRFLQVEVPYHSPKMEPLKAELLKSLNGIRPQPTVISMFSTVTGQGVQGHELDGSYWCKNIRNPVLFANAIDELVQADYNLFLEVGPHPVLSVFISKCLSKVKKEGTVTPSLRHQEPERATMLGSFCKLFAAGYPVDWNRFYPQGGRFVKLPSYPWQRDRHWHESEKSRRERLGQKVHPLLGSQLESAHTAWVVELDKNTPSYLNDHRVQDSVMYPASAYVEMALAAARELFGQETCVLEDIMLKIPIILSDREFLTVQLILDSKQTSFDIYSRIDGTGSSWVSHATGKLSRLQDRGAPYRVSLDDIRSRCRTEVPKRLFYQKFYEAGIQYGPCFQAVERVAYGKWESLGEVKIHSSLVTEIGEYLLHPAMLDACFQVVLGSMASEKKDSAKGVYLPVQIEHIEFYGRPGDKLYSHVLLTEWSSSHIKANINLLDEAGNIFAKINGFRCQLVHSPLDKMDSYLYEYKWKLTAREDRTSVNRSNDYIASPFQITKRLKPEAEHLSKELFRDKHYQTVEPHVRDLVRAYILNAFQKLGWRFSTHRAISFISLAKKLGVVAEQMRFFERLLQILEEDGTLNKIDGRWKFARLPERKDPQEIWRSLWAEFPAYLAELTLLRQCGDNLAGVLSGEVDPLGLIFPQGSLTTLEHFYQDSPTCRIYNFLVQKAVYMALERLPEGRTVRILEIGGGTGGMTSYVLRKLPSDRMEYIFTDVSQLFLSNAEQKFRDYSFVRYQILDIERDPLEQEFLEHSIDIILASDVLHATRDLRNTLNRVKQLLKSDGLLILLEGTRTTAEIVLVFGLLKGWWLFDDDLREKDPWISQEAWQNLLKECGFKEVSSVTDTKNPASAVGSVIIAKGPSVKGENHSKEAAVSKFENPGSWLIFADEKGVGRSLEERLKAQGQNSILISVGEGYKCLNGNHFQIRSGKLEDMQQVVQESLAGLPPCRGVIHLWSLDIPPAEDTRLAYMDKAKDLGLMTVLNLVQVLASRDSSDFPRIFLVTSGAERVDDGDKLLSVPQAPLWGFNRVINNEHPYFRSKIIDLSPGVLSEEIQSLFEELWLDDHEDEVAFRGKARYVHRLTRVSRESILRASKKRVLTRNNQPFSVEITTPGMLDSLTFKSVKRQKPGPGEVEIEIHAAGLNFKDIMIALGRLPDEALEGGYTGKALGMEGAGKIVDVGYGVEEFKIGDEVITCAPGVLKTFVKVNAGFVVKKPKHLSFEEAATIPIAFLTSYYSLHNVGQICKGERILIHAATGGVGLSAIQVAQRIGAEIFATAGTQAKRDLLRALGVKHIMNSRSLSFADEVMQYTKGKGVHIVLNSLAGEAILKSISVLSSYGRFIEIGKRDIYENNKLDLRPFRNNLSFFAIDLDRLCTQRPELGRGLLHEVMRFFEDGTFRPLPHRVFPISEITNAFRYMAQAKHVGKVIVSFHEHAVDPVPLPPKGFSVRKDGTYLITGGLGGFGLATAEWLVERGARNLVLVGRMGATTEEAISTVDAMKKAGVNVEIVKADVTRKEQVARVLRDIHRKMLPLRGVVHAAMVLDDAILVQLNEERMRKVIAPKIIGAWNLHTQTLNLPLDFFVLFSSFSSLIGSPGQGNYVSGNSFLDALSHYRHARGLPSLTVNWGGIADVGYVAENPEIGEKLEHIGLKSLTSQKCLGILGELLQRGATQTGVGNLEWKQLARINILATTPRITHFVEGNLSDGGEGAGAHLIDTIMALKPEDGRQFLESFLCEQVARVLGTSPSKLDVNQPLIKMGMDSLMAIEIGIQIETDLEVNVPTVKFMEGISLSGLAAFVIEQLDAKGSPGSDITDKKASESMDKIFKTSDQEADLSYGKSSTEDVYQKAVFPGPSPLVKIQASGSKGSLFFVHPIGGNVFCYLNLSQRLGKERPFYAIRSLGLNEEMEPLTRIEDMADHYISAIQAVQEKGPYILGGWSMGGIIAFEMAQRLELQGEKMSLLALLDIQGTTYDGAQPEGVGHFLVSLVRDLGVRLDDNDSKALNNLFRLGSDKKWGSFIDFVKDTKANKNIRDLLSKLALYLGLTTDQVIFLFNRYYELGHDRLLDHVGEYVEFVNKETRKVRHSGMRRRLQIYFNNHLANRSYKAKIYRSPVVLFTPSEQLGATNQEEALDWTEFFTGELEIHKVPGNHYSMMEEPNVQVLAGKLSICLEKTHIERR